MEDANYPRPFPPPWADAWGDDRFGLWAALEVKGVVQRMRWIAPGTFMMGSDPKETGRDSDQTQHQVSLTQGFWLADTACTQALWQAVMGNNPSYATDDLEKPVEQVSWDDVQGALGFCQALVQQMALPATFKACLPTEAQWEYACRAGTQTAYHFGDHISTDWCNYDFEGDWEKRLQAKQTTLPVKALRPNAWGLYQMHGNVWEWCADGLRPYTADAVSDPVGPVGTEEGARFAVRGGSWNFIALYARSARRSAFQRDGRGSDLGFRFALRSQAQGAGGPGA